MNNFLTFHPTDWSSGGLCSNSSAQLQLILVVDDDPAILRLVKDKLNRTGFEVFTTTSGQRTLDVIDRRGLPHLAIVDIMMPGMDGFEFRRTVQQFTDLPVIMLTAVDEEETVIRGIEHFAEGTPRVLERLAGRDVMIVSQPPFVYYSGERYLATVAPDILPWMYRVRSPLESGLVVVGSSDTPVVPLNPLVGIYAAVTRKTRAGQNFFPEEAVTPYQALQMYTTNAAYASFEENIKGSLGPGKLADMVVLSDDPTLAPPEKIMDIEAVMTVIGGEVVWEN